MTKLRLAHFLCSLAVVFAALNAVANNAPAPTETKNFVVSTMHPSQMKIFISTRHTLPEYTAALELQRAMRACVNYGQEHHAEIVAADKLPENTAAIAIGSMDSTLIEPYVKQLKLVASDDDEIAHYVLGKHLFIVGNSPRAALYSVIDFMRFRMGVYDLFPGEEGSFYTKAGSGASVPGDLAYNYKPAFRFRMVNGFGNGEEGAFFAVRNFMQSEEMRFGGDRYIGGEAVSPWRSDFKEHSDWFALHKVKPNYPKEHPELCRNVFEKEGKTYARTLPPPTGWSWVINGCWSNEEFTQAVIDRVDKMIDDKHSTHVSLHPADSLDRCECDKCMALADDAGGVSGRWFRYNARLVRELKKRHPECRYSVLAYQEYRENPKIPVEEVEFVEYCNYSRCFVHKIGQDCGTNENDFKRFNSWLRDQKVPVGLWDYTMDVFNPGHMLPVYSYWADLLKYCSSNNVVKIFLEGGPCMSRSRVAAWIAMQMMWKPSQDEEKLLGEYCRVAFGPAAKQMETVERSLANAWCDMPAHLTSCFNNPGGTAKILFSDELIAQTRAAFAKSERLIDAIEAEQKNEKDVVGERSVRRKAQYKAMLDFEKAQFERWIELREKMLKTSVTIPVYSGSGDDDFEAAAISAKTSLNSPNNQPPINETDMKFYWTDEALHLRVECFDQELAALAPVATEPRDTGKLWGGNAGYVEIFVQPQGTQTYWHLAATREGFIYDGQAMDHTWNGKWTVEAKDDLAAKKWVLSFKLPYADYGVKKPANGDTWKMVVVRSGKNDINDAVGLPFPSYHDIGAGADIAFTEGRRP